MTIVGGIATPPLEATAKLLIKVKDEALASFGSGATALVKFVNVAPREVRAEGATFELTTAANEAAEETSKFADAGKAPLLEAASFAKAEALETKDPVPLMAIEAKKAPYAAAAGSVVVIFEVGDVKGSGAVNRLNPGGKPAATATVALATDMAACIVAVDPGMTGLSGFGIKTAAAALVNGVTPNRGLAPVGTEGITASKEFVAPKGS